MWEFLQNYGIWILFGILFLLMMRMHGRGMHGGGGGCGMGMGYDEYDESSDRQRVVPLDDQYSDAQRRALIAGEYSGD